jgi:hypothetical protein
LDIEAEDEPREAWRGEATAGHRRELLLPMRDRLLAVEGLGIGSVNIATLTGSPSFTPLSISSS